MSQYDKKDAARDTDSSSKDVSHAWHDARDDAAKDGGHGVPHDRHHDSDNRHHDGSSHRDR